MLINRSKAMTDPIATIDAINAGIPSQQSIDAPPLANGISAETNLSADINVGWDVARFETLMSGSSRVHSSSSLSSLDVVTNTFEQHRLQAPQEGYLSKLLGVIDNLETSKQNSQARLKALSESSVAEVHESVVNEQAGGITGSQSVNAEQNKFANIVSRATESTSIGIEMMSTMAVSSYIKAVVNKSVSSVKDIVKGR
jgi:hypothetical protein